MPQYIYYIKPQILKIKSPRIFLTYSRCIQYIKSLYSLHKATMFTAKSHKVSLERDFQNVCLCLRCIPARAAPATHTCLGSHPDFFYFLLFSSARAALVLEHVLAFIHFRFFVFLSTRSSSDACLPEFTSLLH